MAQRQIYHAHLIRRFRALLGARRATRPGRTGRHAVGVVEDGEPEDRAQSPESASTDRAHLNPSKALCRSGSISPSAARADARQRRSVADRRSTRLKFPDPVWGRVPEVVRGMSILLITPQTDADLREITYIEGVAGPDDPSWRRLCRCWRSRRRRRRTDDSLTTCDGSRMARALEQDEVPPGDRRRVDAIVAALRR
jgi:hypothetical protein